MGYPYEDLHDKEFERLVVQAMRKLFGHGVQAFAAGRDGGRDALFEGTAERFPSQVSPWKGVTVGQAKHTIGTNRHFSDPDFSGPSESSVLSEELPRIKQLAGNDELTNYVLFSNRRLGGVVGPQLRMRLATELEIPSEQVFLAGIEYLDDLLAQYPEILELAQIDPIDGPLLVSSADIAELILALGDQLKSPDGVAEPVDRTSFEQKNELNSMSPEFADELSKRYLGRTKQIEDFLADPANAEHLKRYEATIEDFQLTLLAKRKDYQSFDEVFNRLFEVLVARDGVLGRNRALLRAMLFYMYWHCDIGLNNDAATK